jgi:hypothetical protein
MLSPETPFDLETPKMPSCTQRQKTPRILSPTSRQRPPYSTSTTPLPPCTKCLFAFPSGCVHAVSQQDRGCNNYVHLICLVCFIHSSQRTALGEPAACVSALLV